MATKTASTKKAPVTKAATAGKNTATKKTAPTQKKLVTNAPANGAKSADKKQKTIRDSFNMPADDYALISAMKKRALTKGRETKKSELLRAGLKILVGMNDAEFVRAIAAVAAIKTGRPVKKHK